MTHHIHQEELHDHLDGTLDPEREEHVNQHLRGCEQCRERLAELERATAALEQGVIDFMEELAPPTTMTFSPPRPHSRRSTAAVFALGAACAALVSVGALVASERAERAELISPSALARAPRTITEAPGSVPDGWSFHQTGDANRCQPGISRGLAKSGDTSAFLWAKEQHPDHFCAMQQFIRSDDFRGKRIKLSAWVRADNVVGWSGLWMRIDGEEETMPFDNMQNRPIQGTHDWTRHVIVLDVPQHSHTIVYGLLLDGSGKVWIDDVVLEETDKATPTTDLFKRSLSNGDFEF